MSKEKETATSIVTEVTEVIKKRLDGDMSATASTPEGKSLLRASEAYMNSPRAFTSTCLVNTLLNAESEESRLEALKLMWIQQFGDDDWEQRIIPF